jgi:hypothetical protein
MFRNPLMKNEVGAVLVLVLHWRWEERVVAL